MKSKSQSRTPHAALARLGGPDPDAGRCLHVTSDGKRCRLPRSAAHPALCFYHAREERQFGDADLVSAELSSLSGDFKTASDINHVLGKLFTLFAQGRVPTRNAAILAYIGQLLLHSVQSVKREIRQVQGDRAWEETLLRAFAKRLPLPAQAGAPAGLPTVPGKPQAERVAG